ncbi:MAG: DmsC/YnfH family molybdoenzyme membrane anchor subunit [Ramlibacter sp.]
MSYGPNPWQQAHWDWRAAGNFIGGGAGTGLLVFTVLSRPQGMTATLLVLAGLVLVGLGLLCVWLEIGRPLRALNVFRKPGASWMSREATVSLLLFPLGLGLALGLRSWAAPVLFVALGYLYCQARMVQAGKGIPAWREPLTVPLMMLTGLAEGAGLYWLGASGQPVAGAALGLLFAVLLLARWVAWRIWRGRVARVAAAPALAAIDRAGRSLQWLGSAVPLVLTVLAFSGAAGSWSPILLGAGGALAALTGAQFKFTLITRASYNQGFALARLPVRGVAR